MPHDYSNVLSSKNKSLCLMDGASVKPFSGDDQYTEAAHFEKAHQHQAAEVPHESPLIISGFVTFYYATD